VTFLSLIQTSRYFEDFLVDGMLLSS